LESFARPLLWQRHFPVSRILREQAVFEAAPDPLAVACISLSALRTMHSVLASGDQHHLYQTAGRNLAVMHRRGDASTVEYWAEDPVMGVALLPYVILQTAQPC
jgi:hypothetical protein